MEKLNDPIVPVSHEYKGGDTVEDGHHEVGQGQVDQKVVGDAPHSTVRWVREYNQSFVVQNFIYFKIFKIISMAFNFVLIEMTSAIFDINGIEMYEVWGVRCEV